MLEQLVESWQINHRVTLRLLEALADDALKATLSTRGGRDVARQLAHVHEVRAGYAEVTSKTNRSAKLPHFAKGESPAKKVSARGPGSVSQRHRDLDSRRLGQWRQGDGIQARSDPDGRLSDRARIASPRQHPADFETNRPQALG